MELPLFALKAGNTEIRRYENNDIRIFIMPSALGAATIHDKDIWIYAVSKLIQAVNEGKEISRTVHFSIYDYLITTNRNTSGDDYERTKDALDRLTGTRIRIEKEDETERRAMGFGLLESWETLEKRDGRLFRVSMTLPDWLYKSVVSAKVKKISPDYFRLRKPIDRRIYELAAKHCGNQKTWKISLELLHKKAGSTSILREFRRAVKSLAESNELPDYTCTYDEASDMVVFKNRGNKSLLNQLVKELSNGRRKKSSD